MLVENYETSGMLNPLVFEILMSFRDTASKQGYEIVLLSTTTEDQKSESLTKLASEKQLDGVFIMGLRTTDEYFLELKNIKLPCVVHDINIDNDLVGSVGVDNLQLKLLNKKVEFTAVFCASDLMAVGAVNMLDNLGYSVPEDISVVGFDDIYIAQYIKPKLITIKQNREKIGQSAANVLVNMVMGQRIGRVMIGPELVVRESTSVT